MNTRLLLLGALLALSSAPVFASPDAQAGTAGRFSDLFQPTRTDLAALAPDGSRIAYTYREGAELSVVIINPSNPGQALFRILVGNDSQANSLQTSTRSPVPLRVNWMKWVTSERLVLETNHVSVTALDSGWSVTPGLITAIDFAGGKPTSRVLAQPRDLQELIPTQRAGSGNRNRTPLAATVDNAKFFERNREGANVGSTLFGSGATNATSSTETFLDRADVTTAVSNTTDEVTTVQEFTTFTRDRTPSVFDLDPTTPGAILMKASGKISSVIYSVDTATGKFTQRVDSPTESDRNYLVDRQGRPRIALPNTVNIDFPHRYELERGAGAAKTDDLDTLLGFAGANRFEVSPQNFFGERAVPVGFGEDASQFYFASNVGRDRFAIYRADLNTGKVADGVLEHPRVDLIPLPEGGFTPPGLLVFDRYTRNLVGLRVRDRLRTTLWLHPVLQSVQALIERSYPGRSVQIVEWDEKARHFLAAVSGPTDAGGFVLFDRNGPKLTEFIRQAPWLDDKMKNRTLMMDVEVEPGLEVHCQLTLSQNPKVKSMPLVVICPPAPWERVSPDYQPEVQAVAEMGFAVLQLSGRGAWGYGVKQRQAIHAGYEDAVANDLVKVVDALNKAVGLDTRYVGLIGSGHGGLVAMRAMELHPTRFRCAIALEPIVNLDKWLREDFWTSRAPGPQLMKTSFGTDSHIKAAKVWKEAGKITRPLLIMSYPGKDGSWRRTAYMSAKAFAHDVRRPDVEVQFKDLSEDFAAGLALGRAEVFREIELFLNTNVYNFNVSIGETKVIK